MAKSLNSSVRVSPGSHLNLHTQARLEEREHPPRGLDSLGKERQKTLLGTTLPSPPGPLTTAQRHSQSPRARPQAEPRPQFTGSMLGADRDGLRHPHCDPDSQLRKASAEAAHGPQGDSSPELFQTQKHVIGCVITNDGRDRQLLNGGNRSTNCWVRSVTAKME